MKTVKSPVIASVMVAVLPLAQAAGPGLSDRFYDAIRTDDTKMVQELLAGGANVNEKDGRGTTPLMYAAATGTPEMMRQLMAAGADVNAKNGLDATALMWSTNDLEKVRLLVDKGADVNARSKAGRTPLLIASAHEGNVEVVRLLLAKGADLSKARDNANSSPLLEAAAANDTAMMELFLEKGEDVRTKNAGGFTPLMLVAGRGNVPMVKKMLARGAEVNAQSGPSYGAPVKNGTIALGNLTPLMFAVTGGSPETVRLLLEAGANVNAQDVRGMTPLMLAAATDHPNEKIMAMLLAKRPAIGVKSKANETALAWAVKFQNPATLAAIRAVTDTDVATSPRPVTQRSTSENVPEAVEKGLALLQKSNGSFLQAGGCLSCHSQNITTMAVATARHKGVHIDSTVDAEVVRGTRLQFAALADGMLQRLDPPVADILTYALVSLGTAGAAPDRVTDAMIHNLAAQQHADGSWGASWIVRPPTSDGRFSVTALAIRALKQYAPPARKAEVEERVARAVNWLMDQTPRTTEDAVMQLLGAKWAGLDEETLGVLAQNLLALQREDGGWGQTPHLGSDAYATGTALYAMHEAGGLASADPAYHKGVRYLLRTQTADGSWYVASRAPKFQPYFDGGFPYGDDQWISQMATGWASMALSLSLPDTPGKTAGVTVYTVD